MSTVDSIRRDNIRRNRTKLAMGSLAVAATLVAAGYGIYRLTQSQKEDVPPDGGGGRETENSSTSTFVGIAVVVGAIVFQIIIFYFRRRIFSIPAARIRTNKKALEGGNGKSLTQAQSDAISDATTRKLTGTKKPKKKRNSSIISTGSLGEWQQKAIGDKVEVLGITHAVVDTRKRMFTGNGYTKSVSGVLGATGRLRRDTASTIDGMYAVEGQEGYSLSSSLFKPVERDTTEVVLFQLQLLTKMIDIVDEYLESVIIKGRKNVPQIQFIFENDGSHPERAEGTTPGRENDLTKVPPGNEEKLLPLKQRIYVPDQKTLEAVRELKLSPGSLAGTQYKAYKTKIYPNMTFRDHNFNNYVYTDQDKKNILTTLLMTIGAEPLIFTYFAQKMIEYKTRNDLTAEQRSRLENNVETPLMRPAMGPNPFSFIEKFKKTTKIFELLKKLDSESDKERLKAIIRDVSFKSENEESPVKEVLAEIEKDRVLNTQYYRDMIEFYIDENFSIESLPNLKKKMNKYSPRIAFTFYDELYSDPTLTEADHEAINVITRDIWAYENLQKYTKNQPKKRNVLIMGSSHNFKDMMRRLGSKISVEQDKVYSTWLEKLRPELKKKVVKKLKEYIAQERERTKEERKLDKAI